MTLIMQSSTKLLCNVHHLYIICVILYFHGLIHTTMMTTVQRPSMDVILAKLTETDKQYNQLLNEMITNNEKETLMIKPVRFGIYRRRNRRRNDKRHKKQKCSKKDCSH
ncbi:hypothetical protein EWB00_010085 [Schistosoma japonicum]|uniref:Uncharacterized protein n=1 Tax=Schistosoma japonicum TaxID=6182 RepID=A0A4Z2DQ03_SCHJA|nr:hypothetical protein EWB00_010085 [Schistosoma japonicum]